MLHNQNFQNTLKSSIELNGIGLFTGKNITLKILPAKTDHGIVFKRVDLPNTPLLQANLNIVKERDRTTFVGLGKDYIQTVEHVLSCLYAYNIDNALIEINGSEIPIFDGSSLEFARLVKKTGIEKQNKQAKIYTLKEAVYFSEKHTQLIAIPSDEFKISFTLHHDTCNFLKSQYFSYVVDSNTYLKEISPSRTYSIYEEIKPLLDNNLIKGGSLKNAVVIKDNKVINEEGIRFANEMVRHKVLDLIGDLALIGKRFKAHIISIRSGHFTNIKFAKKLNAYFLKEI